MDDSQLITVWYRGIPVKDGIRWDYNHIENGYSPLNTTPRAISDEQKKSWAGNPWLGKRGCLVNGKVMGGTLE